MVIKEGAHGSGVETSTKERLFVHEPPAVATPEQASAIAEIDKSRLSWQERMELIATIMDLKGASYILSPGVRDDLGSTLHSLGFSMAEVVKDDKTRSEGVVVAKGHKDASVMAKLLSQSTMDTETHRRIGEGLGYPPSAINAFIEYWEGQEDSYQRQQREARKWERFGRHLSEFVFFAPSDGSLQDTKEEKRWLSRIVSTVREYAPITYQEGLTGRKSE